MAELYGALRVNKPGGPEAMEWADEQLPDPAPGEISILQEAVGVDFIDTQIRSGQMQMLLPTGIGFAAAGEVIAVGSGVDGFVAGDRVAYSWSTPGAYAEARNVPAERAIRLPDQKMDAEIAAGAMFRGLTAWYLATRLRTIKPGDFVLVHAAAGGVGSILTQWLKHLGAVVIGVAGSEDSFAHLRDQGCAHALSLKGDWVTEVASITGGKGCSVVYDSVGKATFDGSLDCVARFGLLVSYGWASGDPDPIPLATLRAKGSIFITRPTISHYTADAEDMQEGAKALFALIGQGAIRIRVGNRYALRDAGAAHTDLVGRRTSGSVVLTV